MLAITLNVSSVLNPVAPVMLLRPAPSSAQGALSVAAPLLHARRCPHNNEGQTMARQGTGDGKSGDPVAGNRHTDANHPPVMKAPAIKKQEWKQAKT